MSDLAEAAASKSQLGADLAAGLDTLSLSDSIEFVKYLRLVLPLDGYVFWVRAGLTSASARFNAARFNASMLNQPNIEVTPAESIIAKGSLHYASIDNQGEEATYTTNSMIFTSEVPVQDFNQIGPNVIYIAERDGIRFAFSSRASFYRLADLYHYRGDAIYSMTGPQIIDDISQISTDLIVSNSLPLWLAMNAWEPLAYRLSDPIGFTLYPSFLVPANAAPPFAAVHCSPESVRPIQSAPYFDQNASEWQLVEETVRITLYGVRNADALGFRQQVQQYMLETGGMGLMNTPVIRDDKATQSELNVLQQRKTVEFRVNYYETTIRTLARQYIEYCIPTLIVDGTVIGPNFPPAFKFQFPDNSFNLALL